MEDSARKLCDAVENEDAKEVENLLEYGADPNLVLPNGIAAIHLASGKESESALRCLTLILQHGGNPNVRSTDDLTPVHVAASWGCCKALTFLLRKGGDPSIQDQDGNTALDLARMENNRRCVVTLQEYRESIADEIRGCHKDDSSSPNDITDVSCITLLLESTYNNSPFPKTVTPENHMDDAVLSIQVEMPSMCTEEEHRIEHETGYTIKTVSKKWELNPTEAKVAVPVPRTSQSSDCSEYFSSYGGSDLTLDNSSAHTHLHCDSLMKTRPLVNQNCRNTINEPMTRSAPLSSHMDSAVKQDLQSNRESGFNCSITDLQVFGEGKGLDVPPPDHNKEDDGVNMEKTLILRGNISPIGNLDEQEADSSDCNTSLWDSGDRRWVSHRTDRSFQDPSGACNQGKGDSTLLSKKYTCKTIHAQSSSTINEDMRAAENEELTGACTQIINCERNGTPTFQGTSQTQRTSQSPTLPVEDADGHGTQDLQIQLRNLLLATKGGHKTGAEAVCTDAIDEKISRQHGHVHSQKVRAEPSSSSSSSSSPGPEDTFIVESHKCYVNEKGDFVLNKDLEKFMLPTTSYRPPFTTSEDQVNFFTPRTKSRLHSFKFRQNISSLFDTSVEMPQRGRRVRSPGGLPASSIRDLPPDEVLPRKTSCSPSDHELIETSERLTKNSLLESTLTNTIPQDRRGSICEPETTLGTSNFLTDDLSSETEVKSRMKRTTGNHCSGGISDSAWLTEDGESEIIAVADNTNKKVDFTAAENSLPASFFHSTFAEDPDVTGCRVPRYSFSRLSCIPKADESTVQSCLRTGHGSASPEVPLSPGGRPVNGSIVEPVEYLYKDNEKGHVLIEKHVPSLDQSGSDTAGSSDNTVIYDWRNYKSVAPTINKAPPVDSPNRVAVELYRLSNAEIAGRLQGLGEDPGQVTSQNRKMCILLLDRCLKEQTSNRPGGLSFDYSPELFLALNTFNIPDGNKDEAELSQQFDQPDKTLKWREGVLKSSFNYLLLDPRVTQNLPSRCHDVSPLDCFRTFVGAVFYVGKGKRSRPYSHLYEALTHYKGGCRQPCSKVQHILDIWKSGQGVLSLHCFQNAIPVEAYTREACMVDAIGLKMLTNQKKGIYYGHAQNWTPTRRRRLGVHMLYKAMQIFLAEGERQLRPPDIRSGQ